MNSITEKKNKTLHEAQFDKRLESTKKQIEQAMLQQKIRLIIQQ